MCIRDRDGADLILNTIGEKSLITKECLASYGVVERIPLKTSFNRKTIYTSPPPSNGGALITFLLKLMDHAETGSASNFIRLVKAMEITSRARREISHNVQDTSQISQVQDPNTFNHYLKLFNSGFNNIPNEVDPPSRGATTHVSILDKQGNAASVTTTNGEGCGYVIPEMGIMLNNMLGEEDLNPMGFHLWTRQQRLPTMMAPTVVMGKKGVELVLGSGGSNRLRSAISQVIINFFVKGMDLKTAVHAARIHLEGNVLHFEPDIQLEDLPGDLQLHSWDDQNLFFGGVNAVTPDDAWGDLRRGGSGLFR